MKTCGILPTFKPMRLPLLGLTASEIRSKYALLLSVRKFVLFFKGARSADGRQIVAVISLVHLKEPNVASLKPMASAGQPFFGIRESTFEQPRSVSEIPASETLLFRESVDSFSEDRHDKESEAGFESKTNKPRIHVRNSEKSGELSRRGETLRLPHKIDDCDQNIASSTSKRLKMSVNGAEEKTGLHNLDSISSDLPQAGIDGSGKSESPETALKNIGFKVQTADCRISENEVFSDTFVSRNRLIGIVFSGSCGSNEGFRTLCNENFIVKKGKSHLQNASQSVAMIARKPTLYTMLELRRRWMTTGSEVQMIPNRNTASVQKPGTIKIGDSLRNLASLESEQFETRVNTESSDFGDKGERREFRDWQDRVSMNSVPLQRVQLPIQPPVSSQLFDRWKHSPYSDEDRNRREERKRSRLQIERAGGR